MRTRTVAPGGTPPAWVVEMLCDADRQPGHGNHATQERARDLGVCLRVILDITPGRSGVPAVVFAEPRAWQR